MCRWIIVVHRASGEALSCYLLRFVLSFGEFMSRGEKARRIFRQLERVVRTHAVEWFIDKVA